MASYQPPPPPGYPGQPAGQDPGRTLGIVGLVLSILGLGCGLSAVAGVIVSAIGLNKSKAAGYKNTLALVGLILGVVFIVLGFIITFTYTLPMLQQVQ